MRGVNEGEMGRERERKVNKRKKTVNKFSVELRMSVRENERERERVGK